MSDGRKVSRLVVDAEDRLGEILSKQRNQEIIKDSEGSSKGTLSTLPSSINKKEPHYYYSSHTTNYQKARLSMKIYEATEEVKKFKIYELIR